MSLLKQRTRSSFSRLSKPPRAGLVWRSSAETVDAVPFPPATGAIVLEEQAQFHVRKTRSRSRGS